MLLLIKRWGLRCISKIDLICMYLTPVKIKVAFRWGSDQFFPVSSKA